MGPATTPEPTVTATADVGDSANVGRAATGIAPLGSDKWEDDGRFIAVVAGGDVCAGLQGERAVEATTAAIHKEEEKEEEGEKEEDKPVLTMSISDEGCFSGSNRLRW